MNEHRKRGLPTSIQSVKKGDRESGGGVEGGYEKFVETFRTDEGLWNESTHHLVE